MPLSVLCGVSLEQHPVASVACSLSVLLQAHSDSSVPSPHCCCSFCDCCFLARLLLALFFPLLMTFFLAPPPASKFWQIEATIPSIHFSNTASESPASESPIIKLLPFLPSLL